MDIVLTRQQKQLVIKYTKGWESSAVKGWVEGVKGKLGAENLSINSSWDDINNCLSRTVCPDLCISVAYILKYKKG